MKKFLVRASVGALLLFAMSLLWGALPGAGTVHAEQSAEDAAMVRVNCNATTGLAGIYPCEKVDLMAVYVSTLTSLGGTGADIWGWTDEASGREFVIQGHSLSTSFVEITDPEVPVYLGFLPAPSTANALWRDVKVYANHAYITGDFPVGSPHGLQVFDLTQLLGVVVPTEFSATNVYYGPASGEGSGLNSAHNVAINEESGTAFIVGSDTCSGGLHMADLSDPANPTFVGCFSDDGYTHDVQCVNYDGPDVDYSGREICMAANEDTLTVVDVTDRANPVMVDRETYAGVGYSHQGWLTEDHAYFVLGDELDEQNNGHNTHSYIWDVRNLDDIQMINTYVGETDAIDHNLYIKDNLVYEANYQAGLRILDATDIANGNLTEVAYFDTFPAADVNVYAGSWSVYPYFPSGNIVVGNIFGEDASLFIVRPHDDVISPPTSVGLADLQAGGNVAGWLAPAMMMGALLLAGMLWRRRNLVR